MVTEVIGNLLEADVCTIVHQANLFHTFGAGLARAIRAKYPAAYEADLKTKFGDKKKLGTFSWAVIPKAGDSTRKLTYIANLYSQIGIGGTGRQTNYDAMVDGLSRLKDYIYENHDRTLGIPYQLGCGLANGDWRIVRAIIESTFDDDKIAAYIYKLPEYEA
jgi:O-acetyl-ADP-ribose deacetylase (regulator of RNase III)